MSWISWIAGRKTDIDERRAELVARIDAVNESLERTSWRLNGNEDRTDRRVRQIPVIMERRRRG